MFSIYWNRMKTTLLMVAVFWAVTLTVSAAPGDKDFVVSYTYVGSGSETVSGMGDKAFLYARRVAVDQVVNAFQNYPEWKKYNFSPAQLRAAAMGIGQVRVLERQSLNQADSPAAYIKIRVTVNPSQIASIGAEKHILQQNAVLGTANENLLRQTAEQAAGTDEKNKEIMAALEQRLRANTLLEEANRRYVAKDYDQALELYNQVLARESHCVEAIVNKGSIYYLREAYDQAVRELNQAIKVDPQYVYAYYYRGLVRYQQGSDDQALADFDKAVSLAPDFALAYYYRGNCYYMKGQYDTAIGEYSRALELDPWDAYAYLNRANVYREQNQLERAIPDYTRALAIQPDLAAGRAQRANANYLTGRYKEAAADYTELIKLDGKDAVAYVGRAQALQAMGRNPQALADYNAALALDPKIAGGLTGRGGCYLMAGRYDEAIADLTNALTQDSADYQAYEWRGVAYLKKDMLDLALVDLDKAVTLHPRNASAYFNLAIALEAKEVVESNKKQAEAVGKTVQDPKDPKTSAFVKDAILRAEIADQNKRMALIIGSYKNFLKYAPPGHPGIERAKERLKVLDKAVLDI